MNKLISFGRKIIQKSKHLQETALQIIKQNWSKVIQEIITFFLIGFVGIGVTLGLSFLFKPLIDVFIGAYVLILMTYFTIKLLVFVSWIFFLQERKNFKKLLKSRNQNKGSLFDTLTMTNQTDLFFFELLDDDQKGNIHDNMTEIKGKIINKLGHDIYDYHRFLGYLNLQIKNNIFSKMGLKTASVLVGVTSALLTRVITSDSGINRINELFFSKDNNNFEVIRNMFDVSSIIIVILLIIIFMYFEMSKENRRIEFMKMILESIIKEKENDNQIA